MTWEICWMLEAISFVVAVSCYDATAI
jgi:hypothetical protein